MGLEGMILSERSQAKKDKYCTVSLRHRIFKKKKKKKPHRKVISGSKGQGKQENVGKRVQTFSH